MQFNLDAFQAEHKVWQNRNFPGWQPWEVLLGLSLCHAHLKSHQGIRTNEDHEADARDAVGDIVVFLTGYCNARGWLLSEVLDEVWSKVKIREWRDTGN